MKKILLLALVALGLIVATPQVAGAYTYDPSGGIYYQSSPGNSTNQCAWWDMYSADTTSSSVSAYAATAVSKGSGCGSGQTLPAGWMKVTIQLQKMNTWTNPLCIHNFSCPWVNHRDPVSAVNNSTTNIVQLGKTWCLSAGTYRVVTGHEVLLNGAARQYLHVPPFYEFHTLDATCV